MNNSENRKTIGNYFIGNECNEKREDNWIRDIWESEIRHSYLNQ
jgi:hypothetical protein